MTRYSVSLKQIAEETHLTQVYIPDDYEQRIIYNSAVNRPGMQLIGFFTRFDDTRLQVFGVVEIMYLKTLPSEERRKIFAELFKRNIPAAVICNKMEVYPECWEEAARYKVPLFSTSRDTSEFCAELIGRLSRHLAPRITRHGVLVSVYGEGVLLTGDSGVGKSETAIELVKRGHMLVADDAVEIKRVSYNTLTGSAPELIRHYIELRGIGIIDVRRLFGMGAVSDSANIDLIIGLEVWDDNAHYDRLGSDTNYTELLEVQIPYMIMPVRPGRNLAVIVEVAAMNNKLKRMGINSAAELEGKVDGTFISLE